MLKRFALIGGALALVFAAASDGSAQVRRGPVRRVVVVNSFGYSPFWYGDPFFYDAQWGYPGYPVYGGYRRYAPADSSVKFDVKPNKAEVYVDGYYAGIVDDFDGAFQRLHVAPGQHEIELYLDGYRTVRQKVYLTPDNTFKLKYDMEKLGPGDQPEGRPQPLAPQADPNGPGPQTAPPPYPQPYPVPPRNTGGRRAPQPPPPPPGAPADPRDVRPGDAGPVGTLAIRIQPGDADVRVDGEMWHGPEGQDRLIIDLPEGRHNVEVRKPGFRTYVTDVDVRRGETTPLNVSLRSQDQQ